MLDGSIRARQDPELQTGGSDSILRIAMAATATKPLLSYWPIAGADARSLGLFRICLGSLCIYDLLQRAIRMPIHWYLRYDRLTEREEQEGMEEWQYYS